MKLTRETWRVLALIAAGWFIHDILWHFLIVAYGMSGGVTMEFSLPDLEALDIHPDRRPFLNRHRSFKMAAGCLSGNDRGRHQRY